MCTTAVTEGRAIFGHVALYQWKARSAGCPACWGWPTPPDALRSHTGQRGAMWHGGACNSRMLAGFMSTQAPTHVSTKPPIVFMPFLGLYSGTGITYATFSIL